MGKILGSNNEKLSLWKKPITWGLILLAIIMPIITTIATSVLHSPFKNFTISNDWIGFFGSYMGAIIGGFITLLVMHTTIENGDKNLRKTMQQNKELQNEHNKIEFCNDIATIVAEFCCSICALCENLRNTDDLRFTYEYNLKNYNDRARVFEEFREKNIGSEILKQRELECEKFAEKIHDEKLAYLKAKDKLPKDEERLYKTLFLLEIKLRDIETSKMLIEKVKKLKAEINLYTIAKHNEYDRYKDTDELFGRIDDILKETTNFINQYSKK